MSLDRHKRVALIVFAVFVIGAFVIAAAAQGIGDPTVPTGDIAVVDDAPDGTITREEFDSAVQQAAAGQGLKQVPATDDPQYQQFSDQAVSDLLLGRWVLGEGQERGIEVADREIDTELEKVIKQEFGGQAQYEKFLKDSGFTEDDARQRIELRLISQRIQEDVLPSEPSVSDQEIQDYYDANTTQFAQPESRDVRVVLAKDQADADAALQQLGTAPTPKDWDAVAKKYSTDEATQNSGGLRERLVPGQSDPAVDAQIFAAPQGDVVGPVKTPSGFYVFQVEAITPAQTTPLDDVREQIRQTLATARQQEIAADFQADFQDKWISRTFCADEFANDRCSNAPPPPDTCQGDDEGEELLPDPATGKPADELQCDAVVPSTKPIAPGTATVVGTPPTQPLPQGPIAATPDAGALPPGLPPGVTIPGATGAPTGAPPGTVPPGG